MEKQKTLVSAWLWRSQYNSRALAGPEAKINLELKMTQGTELEELSQSFSAHPEWGF